MVPRRRFERPTCRLGGGCSIQLSYRSATVGHYKKLFKQKPTEIAFAETQTATIANA